MAAFRKLKDDEGATLQDNYRFIRPKAGRTVYRYGKNFANRLISHQHIFKILYFSFLGLPGPPEDGGR